MEQMTIDMGLCKTCGKRWSMTEAEQKEFDQLVREKNYQYPKSCKECRSNKNYKETVQSYNTLMSALARMTKDAEAGKYTFEDKKLGNDLREIHQRILALLKRVERYGLKDIRSDPNAMHIRREIQTQL